MNKLFKQIIYTLKKKPGLIFTLGLVNFVSVFLTTTLIGILGAIATSINDTNTYGNAATAVINNLKTVNNVNFEPNINDIAKNSKTVVLNMNAIDVDDTSLYSNYSFLRIFPYKRSDLLNNNSRKNFNAANFQNFIAYSPAQIRKSNKLNFLQNHFKYAESISFINPLENTLNVDPRKIMFSYDQSTNSPNILGYWNEGSINENISLYIQFATYKNTNNNGDIIFNNPNYSVKSLFKNTPNNELSDSWNNTKLDDSNSSSVFSLSSPNMELLSNRLISNYLYDYLRSLDFLSQNSQQKPLDPYEPFLELIDGYSIPFTINTNTTSPIDEKFQQYLNSLVDKPAFLKPLILDEFKLLGMSLSDYQLLNSQQQLTANQKIYSNLQQYGISLSNQYKKAKIAWMEDIFFNALEYQNINYNLHSEMYYQNTKNNNEFLFIPKTDNQVNNLLINEGSDLSYNEQINELKRIIPSQDETLTLKQLHQFLEFLITFQFPAQSSSDITNYKNVVENCLVWLNNNPNATLSEFAQSGEWYAFTLSMGTNFKIDSIDTFNYTFRFDSNFGFTSLFLEKELNKNNYTNFFVVLSDAYYDVNKKKSIPKETQEVTIDGVKKTIYGMDDFMSNNLATISTLSDFNNYLMNTLPEEYKISYYDHVFMILGSGYSPDYIYPIVSTQSPIPNPRTQGLVYMSMNTYEACLKYSYLNNNNATYALYRDNTNFEQMQSIVNSSAIQLFGDASFLNIREPSKQDFIVGLRYQLPILIRTLLIIGISLLLLILLIIAIYVCYLLLNVFINQLNIPISIAKADGLSNFKIFGNIFAPIGIFSSIVSALGYILTFSISTVFFTALSGIWFLPLGGLAFNPYIFLGGLLISLLFFGLITASIVFFKYRKPILDTLNDVENIKANKLMGLLRINTHKISPIWKFRNGLTLSRFWKLLILLLLLSGTFAMSVTTYTMMVKSEEALVINNDIKKYEYAIDLESSNEANGLYRDIPYSDIGITNPSLAITNSPLYDYPTDPYGKLLNDPDPNKRELLALRDLSGNVILDDKNNPIYFTNTILPSYNAFVAIQNNVNLFFNSSLSVFTCDIDLNFGQIQLGNIWQNFVKPLLPSQVAFQMQSSLDELKNNILIKYPDFAKFLVKDQNGNLVTPYKINALSVIDLTNITNPINIRLKDEYLKFLGKIFADKEIMESDNKLIGGTTIAVNDKETALMNNLDYYDETYTYAYINLLSTPENKNINQSVKLMGIKPDSDFINLKTDDGTKINLNDLKSNQIVINNGASYEFGLQIGDSITFDVLTDYYNLSYNIANVLDPNFKYPSKQKTFKIAAISSDPVGTAFYTTQSIVNEVTNYNKGDFVEKIDINYYNPRLPSNVKFMNLATYQQADINYVPFNGIFTNRSKPIIGDKVISLFSKTGLYSSWFNINDSLYIPHYDPKVIGNLFMTRSNLEIFQQLNIPVDNLVLAHTLLVDKFVSYFSDSASNVLKWIAPLIDDVQITINPIGIDSTELTDGLFNVTKNVIMIINILCLSIFLPILLSTIIVSIISIVESLKKQIGILRVLGYSSPRTTRSILYMFIPTILLSLGIGTGFLFGLLAISQAQIFNLTSIFVPTLLNAQIYLIGIGVILALIVLVYLVTYIFLKKNKYSQIIKN